MNITNGKIEKAQRVVIFGPEGIGKTTLGSKFPYPVFIDTEGSTEQLDVARTDKPLSWAMLKSQVQETASMDFKTLVIDSIDWAEKHCIENVCVANNKSSIADFGYGAEFTHLEEEFRQLLNLLDLVREKGIHVVLIAHSQIKKFEQPDEIGAYDRWELKLSKKVSALVKEWADMILFANYETFSVEDEKTKSKKAQGGRRVMHTAHNPCWDAKNRHGLEDKLNFDFSEIEHLFAKVSATHGSSVPVAEKLPENIPCIDPSTTPEKITSEVKKSAPIVSETVDFDLEKEWGVTLAKLMGKDNVSSMQIRQVVAKRGHYLVGTKISSYDDEFVTGALIPGWDQVVSMIREMELESIN